MPPVPERIRELRGIISTTFNTAHTNAASGTWAAGTARKPRIIGLDASGLEYAAEQDPTLESIHTAGRANIPTLRTGAVKFDMWLEGGDADGGENELATWMEACMGGVQAGAATDATDSSGVHTTAKVYAADIDDNVTTGQGVLVGTRGDGDGEAEGRVVTGEGSDYFDVGMLYQGAPADGQQIRIGTTVFWDPTATQKYIDLLAIGKSAEDQIQTIGGVGTFELSGLSMGELPKASFNVQCADWQEVPSANRDALEPATAADGNNPAHLRGTGALLIGDNGNTARAAYKVADVSINPGITYEAVNGMNGVNGIEGFVKMSMQPTLEATVLLEGGTDPLPGFYDDFVAGTAKQVFVQFGSTLQKTVLVDFPRAYFSVAPVRSSGGNFAAVKITMHGTTLNTIAETTANYLANSPMRIHFF